ncbi:MAG: DUF2238 domain-containing protein [Calditrichaeota bacterium]|nr:MAG: DUF2238 domain-containing protein [Calditrichota bacterium]
MAQKKLLITFSLLLVIEWVWAAINPYDRKDWMLENILVILFVPVLWSRYTRALLSRFSYTLLFVFLYFHLVGSHYTYAQVPYKEWIHHLTGWDWGPGRNQFDRLVHFLYGFLFTIPLMEWFTRRFRLKGFIRYFLPVNLIMSTSMIYELIEWLVAELFGGDLGQAYLGTQGDVWDAHKDMALASLGSILIATGHYLYNRYYKKEEHP